MIRLLDVVGALLPWLIMLLILMTVVFEIAQAQKRPDR